MRKPSQKSKILKSKLVFLIILLFLILLNLLVPAGADTVSEDDPQDQLVTEPDSGGDSEDLRPAENHTDSVVSHSDQTDSQTDHREYFIFLVLDDGGHNMEDVRRFTSLPLKLTIAILPELAYSSEAADLVYNSGNDVLLHQPMEPVGNADPGPGAIYRYNNVDEIKEILDENMKSVPHMIGLNNHMGSLITANPDRMNYILKWASEKGLLFLDSYTSSDSVAAGEADKINMDIIQREIFLDNEETMDSVKNYFQQGLEISKKNGKVVMIGHVWSDVLYEYLINNAESLMDQGFVFKPISEYFN